jgi:hypothetical protein
MVQSDGTIAHGVGGAFGAARYVSSLLYGVSASDGATRSKRHHPYWSFR